MPHGTSILAEHFEQRSEPVGIEYLHELHRHGYILHLLQ